MYLYSFFFNLQPIFLTFYFLYIRHETKALLVRLMLNSISWHYILGM